MSQDCIFCKIVAGTIPCHKVYEDEHTLAFLDIAPQSKGHVLLIPKKEYGRIEFVPDDLLSYMILKSKEIIPKIKTGLNCDYVQVEMVGLGVPNHFHIHLIPRMNQDVVPESPHQTYNPGEAEEIVNKIK